MPINTPHPNYVKYSEQWERIRNTFDGSDAVKAQGNKYLPKLKGQDKDEYDAYKMRALYFDGVERTVRGLVGAVMRVEPIIEAPDALVSLFHDITNTGVSLNNLISIMLQEQLLMGRQGLLCDYDNRPYLVHYATEQITNWLDDKIILQEAFQIEKDDDIYDVKYKTQYRELSIENSQYVVNIWQKNDKDEWVKGENIVANKNKQPLDFIPFVSVSTDGFNLEPSKSSILSLSDVSLSLYRTSADLEHGRHYVALPTPYVTDYDAIEGAAALNIGPSKVWLLPSKTPPGYLEFSGQGLKALEVGMDEKRTMMASLGSQLLQGQKSGVEAADTVRLRQNAEASTLIGAVKMVEGAITQALTIMNDWQGGTGDISVKINTDFVDSRMSPQDITALMSAWQSGAVSHDTFLFNLKRGEILNSDIETEKDKIDIENVG